MRNVLLILAGALLIAGCKKELNVQEPEFSSDIGPVNPYTWTSMPVPIMQSYPFNGPEWEPYVALNQFWRYSNSSLVPTN